VSAGRQNWYHFFIKRAVDLTGSSGAQAFIVPLSLLGDQFTQPLRTWLLKVGFRLIDAFPQKDDPNKRVFFDAKLPTCVYVVKANSQSERFNVRTHRANTVLGSSASYNADVPTLRLLDPDNVSIPLVSEAGWLILKRFTKDANIGKLRDYGAVPTSGEIVFNDQFRKYLTESPTGTLILRGSHVQRWEVVDEAKQGEPMYLKKQAYLKDAKSSAKAFHHEKPRVVYQECAAIDNWRRVIAAYLPAGNVCGHKICYFMDNKCAPLALLAVFNSKLIDWVVTALSTNNSLPAYLVGSLPFPKFPRSPDSHQNNASEIYRIYEQEVSSQSGFPRLLASFENEAKDAHLVTIHDLLSLLAEQMITLNDTKHQCAKELIDWLEQNLTIHSKEGENGVSALSGKVVLKNFIGDYQHGEAHVPFQDLFDILVKNSRIIRSKLDAKFEGAFREKYEDVMCRALPIKAGLSATDHLIDVLVYKAYNLTQAEIKVVESDRDEAFANA
jgi:hypothetical protein